MRSSTSPRCVNCEHVQKELEQTRLQLAQAQEIIAQLRKQLACAHKDSTTSSKPPSSDIVKPSKPAPPDGESARSIGGQPGHPAHFRAPYPPEQVTAVFDHRLTHCPDCQQLLEATPQPPRIIQQIDLVASNFSIEEHRGYTQWCPHCHKSVEAPLPKHIVKGGLLGPQLTARVAYLKGVCHASFSTIRKYFRDVLEMPISRGHLAKVVQKVSASLQGPYAELLAKLPDEERVNGDETGHKLNGDRWWTWCFRAELFVLYRIDAHRSADVLMEVLGKDFRGILGCDYFGAYRRFMRECHVTVQFCLAHLIRDIKFLTTLPNRQDKAYGERLREELRKLFAIIHERETLTETEFQRRLTAQRQVILEKGTTDVPPGRYCQTMAKRLLRHGESYFTFITTPGVEPTNNVAEQAIRFVVIDRLITQGTRSEAGNRWCERIWTVIGTCALTGKSVMTFLLESIKAFWAGEPEVSLLS